MLLCFLMIKARPNYIRTVNIAKGIGIILVVIGHHQPPDTPTYFINLTHAIYKFHMPLFFMLSGYLFIGVDLQSYANHIKKKIRRLLYPFISVAILFAVIKYFSGLFITLYHPLTLNELKEFFICPVNSFAPMLWFIEVLLIIYIVYPLINNLFNNKVLVFVTSTFLYSISAPQLFCLNNVFQSLPYFALGTLLSNIDFDHKVSRLIIMSAAVFGTLLFLTIFYKEDYYNLTTHNYLISFRNLILGINGIVVCILLSVFLNQYANTVLSKCIEKIGYYSMSIYLFHTIFMNLPIIFMSQLLNIKSMRFELQASIAILSGIISPLLLEKYVLRKYNISGRLLLGLSK